jgi:hypothetical protein
VVETLRVVRSGDSNRIYEVAATAPDGTEIGRADRGHLLSPWRLIAGNELVGTMRAWWRRSPRVWYEQRLRYDISDADAEIVGAIHAQPPGWQVIEIQPEAGRTFRCLVLAASALLHLR